MAAIRLRLNATPTRLLLSGRPSGVPLCSFGCKASRGPSSTHFANRLVRYSNSMARSYGNFSNRFSARFLRTSPAANTCPLMAM